MPSAAPLTSVPGSGASAAPFNSLEFAMAARALARAAVALGLRAPGFRCPPRLPGVDRTLRRRADGSAIVAVRVRNRPVAAVVADMVEGVMAANQVDQAQAGATRGALWDAVGSFGSPGAEVHSAADVLYRSSAARVA